MSATSGICVVTPRHSVAKAFARGLRAFVHHGKGALHRRRAQHEGAVLRRRLARHLRQRWYGAVIARMVGQHYIDMLLFHDLFHSARCIHVAVQARYVLAEVERGPAPEQGAVRYAGRLHIEYAGTAQNVSSSRRFSLSRRHAA